MAHDITGVFTTDQLQLPGSFLCRARVLVARTISMSTVLQQKSEISLFHVFSPYQHGKLQKSLGSHVFVEQEAAETRAGLKRWTTTLSSDRQRPP